ILAIVQARFSSRRLPGKVLAPVAGKPMLAWLLERLAHVEGLDEICVATSRDVSDDAVATFCRAESIDCHRGSLEGVAARLLEAAETRGADAFVRVNGDSPLLDPRIVSRAVSLYRKFEPDLVSNVLVRSFPKGQSVEVVRTATLKSALDDIADAEDREH